MFRDGHEGRLLIWMTRLREAELRFSERYLDGLPSAVATAGYNSNIVIFLEFVQRVLRELTFGTLSVRIVYIEV
jgi:hypothetical protein